MKTVDSISVLKAHLMNKMKFALVETVEESLKDLNKNVDRFYNSPEGGNSRIGQFAVSSLYNEIQIEHQSLIGYISLDVDIRNNSSGLNKQTIYNYQNTGILNGISGLWPQNNNSIEHNLKRALAKQFQ